MDLVLDFFLVSGVIIIAIILLQLFKSKERELPQKVLIVLFSLLFFVSLYFYALLHNVIWLIRLCFFPNDITAITLGPLLFLYVKSLFLKEDNLVKNNLVHFIPAVVFAIGITIPTILFNLFRIDALAYTHSDFIRMIIRLESIYVLVYLVISLRLLFKYRSLVKYKYSSLTEYDFNWVKIMLLSAIGIMSIETMLKIFESIFGNLSWNGDYLSVLAMIVLVVYLGYYGVNQAKVLLPSFLLKIEEDNKINKTISNSKKEEFEILKAKLEILLNKDCVFEDEDLTLGKLAQQISTTDKLLSAMLNQYMNTTFYALINQYRVDAVKEKMTLDEYSNYNLFGIACECGFKSRTSFNRIFKKETGFSPSDYKKSIL